MKKILFVCTEGKNRSVTAKELYTGKHETRSIGIWDKKGIMMNPALEENIAWADELICMEGWQEEIIRSYLDLHDKIIHVLEIPDNFLRGDEELKLLIEEKMKKIGY